MLLTRRLKRLHSPLLGMHRKSCITNTTSFINLLDNQPPPSYYPRDTFRNINRHDGEDDHPWSVDSILPKTDDAHQQASLLSTITEMFSTLTEFDGLSSGMHAESRQHDIPPSISILPVIQFNTVSDVLKKIYDEHIFGETGEQEYWRMVVNDKVIDDSFMTGIIVGGAEGVEDALTSGSPRGGRRS